MENHILSPFEFLGSVLSLVCILITIMLIAFSSYKFMAEKDPPEAVIRLLQAAFYLAVISAVFHYLTR